MVKIMPTPKHNYSGNKPPDNISNVKLGPIGVLSAIAAEKIATPKNDKKTDIKTVIIIDNQPFIMVKSIVTLISVMYNECNQEQI